VHARSRKGGEQSTSNVFTGKDCSLVELSLLNRSALSVVNVGEVLNIEHRRGPPEFLVVITKDGRALGAIISPSTQSLMRNIAEGRANYVARVLQVSGLTCKVEVLSKPQK
jgi:hypothetical protein